MQKIFDYQKAIEELDPEQLKKFVEIWFGWNVKGNRVDNNDITDISFLKDCEMMEKLYIYEIQITDLPIGNAVKLKYIQIISCKNLQNINGLEGCNQLEEIHIRTSNITDIAVLGKLKNLKKITIYYCYQITDYDVLEGCIRLTFLWIRYTNISDISPIANLKNLETLYSKDNNQLPEQFQKYICNNNQEAQKFLDECKQTQQYKDYQYNKQQKQKYYQLRVSLRLTQITINQFQNKINKMIYQYKVNLVNTMKKIIEFQ